MSEILTSLSFRPNLTTTRNSLITNHLHNSIIVGIPCAYMFWDGTRFTLIDDGTRLTDATGDRLEVASSSSSAQVLLRLFRAVESSISGTALVCSTTLHCSFVCERSGQRYGRAVFISDDLAIQGGPR